MEITDIDVAKTIRTSLLAHGCEAVYGQIDWNAVARDVLSATGYRPQEATGAPSAAEPDQARVIGSPGGTRPRRRSWVSPPSLMYPDGHDAA